MKKIVEIDADKIGKGEIYFSIVLGGDVKFNNSIFFNLLAVRFIPANDINRIELIKYLLKNGIDINTYTIDNHGLKRNGPMECMF